jgi:glycosyltransferase involved in cell wall biosynthesis
MAQMLGLPVERFHRVPLGIDLTGHDGEAVHRENERFTVGYFARVCPEKGLHRLVDAFLLLRRTPGTPPCRLRVSGWLGANNRPYLEEQMKRLADAGLAHDFEHVESPTHVDKVAFLHSIDVLSVPTVYREPKGLYVLEGLANGVPVVQPRHGSFPELIEATGGGLLVAPGDAADLARGLRYIMEDREGRERMARAGKEAVHRHFHAERMARETAELYQRYT